MFVPALVVKCPRCECRNASIMGVYKDNSVEYDIICRCEKCSKEYTLHGVHKLFNKTQVVECE